MAYHILPARTKQRTDLLLGMFNIRSHFTDWTHIGGGGYKRIEDKIEIFCIDRSGWTGSGILWSALHIEHLHEQIILQS